MNKTVITIIRFVFGAGLLFFGTNKLFHYVVPPPPPEAAQPFWEILTVSHHMTLVGIVETLAAISLFLNRYVALTMFMLAGTSLNVLVYHLTLDSAALPMGIVLLVLNVVMMYAEKDKYSELLKG